MRYNSRDNQRSANIALETVYDGWFLVAVGTAITAASVGLNILAEADVQEPRAGIIAGSFAVAAVVSGIKALKNFRERLAIHRGA